MEILISESLQTSENLAVILSNILLSSEFFKDSLWNCTPYDQILILWTFKHRKQDYYGEYVGYLDMMHPRV